MGHTHIIVDNGTPYIIDPKSRAITNESGSIKKIMQYDHDSERLAFICPRYVDGHDMSLCDNIQVYFINTDSKTFERNTGYYTVNDIVVDETDAEKVTFTWLIDQRATLLRGALSFQVKFECMEESTVYYRWQTDFYNGLTVIESGGDGNLLVDPGACEHALLLDSLITRTITEYETNRLTYVGSNAFANCTKLVNVNLPLVTKIGYCGFYYCHALKNIYIPLVTTIENDAFQACRVLEMIDLPNVTSIGSRPFVNCYELKTVILRSETMCTLGQHNEPFYNTPIAKGTGYIYVPRALIDTYTADSVWSTFADQFRALEDYTVDGTITGELDSSKI